MTPLNTPSSVPRKPPLFILILIVLLGGCKNLMEKAASAEQAGHFEEAVQWYTKAGHAGDPEAEFQMGEHLRMGKGIPRNLEEASEWYLKAANQSHVAAQAYAGLFRLGLEGATLHLDYNEAFRLLRSAANDGNALAQMGLAYMNEIGTFVTPQNYNEAVVLLTKAADQGNDIAQTHLRWLVRDGVGTPEDKAETLKYMLGASIGNVNAMRALGYMYQQGRGIPQDRVEAYRWLQAALARGDEPSRAALTRLQTEMTIEQITKAQKSPLFST